MREQQPKADEKAASQAQGSQQAIRAEKASTLVDMPVRNQQGEMMGEVEDVMIDPSEGRVAYVILDLGGWFDIGGNLVAPPMEALSLSSGEETFTLNVDKAKLRNAPTVAGAYRPAWPVTVRRPWLVDMYGYYGYPPYSALTAVTVDTLDIASAEAITGIDVENLQGDDLGEIEALVIDLGTGRIVYAMMEYGGWLGMGEELAAVPWKALTPAPGEREFRLDITQDQLKTIPRFAPDDWSQTLDRQWLADVYARYGEKPYWGTK